VDRRREERPRSEVMLKGGMCQIDKAQRHFNPCSWQEVLVRKEVTVSSDKRQCLMPSTHHLLQQKEQQQEWATSAGRNHVPALF
jgi:hypothetical protein